MQKTRKMRMWHRNRQQGFSLIELCIAIAIAAIIAAIVIPLGLSMRQRYQLRASATDVLSAMKRAQTEAVKRGSRVAVMISIGNGTCTVFADDGGGTPANANNLILDATEQTLVTTNVQPGTFLQNDPVATAIPLVNGNPSIEFNSGGIPYTTIGPLVPPPIAIDIVSSAGLTVQYQVVLNVTGHVNLLTSTDSGATFH